MNIAGIKINKNSVAQYLYIYLMIEFVGGRFYTILGGAKFGVLIFLLAINFFRYKGNCLKKDKKYFNFVICIFFLFLATTLYTLGKLSIFTVITTISKFLIVYMAIAEDKDRFLERILKVIYILSLISLVIFGITVVFGYDRLAPIYTKLYEIKNGSEWLGSTYGIFFIVFNLMDPTRNAYMFGEPGEYQIIILVAMYLLLFKSYKLDSNKKKKYLIVYIITLMSIQSTTGFIGLIVIAIATLFQSYKIVTKKIKYTFGFLGVILIIYVVLASKDSFIYTNFFNKIFSSSGSIDLSVSTGEARVEPIMLFGECIKNNLKEVIFGVGYEGLRNTSLGEYTTSGLINSIMMFGVINMIIFYGIIIKNIFKYSINLIDGFLVIFLIINMGLSQPDLICSFSILIGVYGIIMGKSNVIERRFRLII